MTPPHEEIALFMTGQMGNVGELFFRDAGEIRKGVNATMVVGILQGPPLFKGEHLYAVTTDNHGRMRIMTHNPRDITEAARGMGLGSLVKAPIWRVSA